MTVPVWRQRLGADLLMVLVALLWGVAFVAQRAAAPWIGPITFTGTRFLIGALLLLPLGLRRWSMPPPMVPWVAAAGVVLGAASWLQQAGLRYTTAANAGFITGLYVVLVPVVLAFGWRQAVPLRVWGAAILAVLGTGLLSLTDQLRLSPGDGLELLGALLWAVHVVLVGRIVARVEVVSFAIGQYAVNGVLSLAVGLAFEGWPTVGWTLAVWQDVAWGVGYTAVFSTAIAYTLQGLAQRYAPPSDAALILSLEAVFAALSGHFVLGERLPARQQAGCLVIFGAIVLSQLRRSGTGTGSGGPGGQARISS
jgi:drug/metabolite transporter (DMT)-like permease